MDQADCSLLLVLMVDCLSSRPRGDCGGEYSMIQRFDLGPEGIAHLRYNLSISNLTLSRVLVELLPLESVHAFTFMPADINPERLLWFTDDVLNERGDNSDARPLAY